jgi:drug/metabolite transporter (DMT)-like permease
MSFAVNSVSTEPPSTAQALDVRALLVLIAGVCTLALTPVFVRLGQAGPAAIGFWRLAFAVPFLVVPLLWIRAGAKFQKPPPALLAAGLLFALDLTFWHYGVKLTSVANSTTLANLAQVFVVAGAWILFREAPRKLFLMGLALALAGVWAMAAAKGGGGHGTNPVLGDIVSLGAAVWYASYLLIVHQARAEQGALRIMLWTSLIGAPVMLVIAFGLHEQILPSSMSGWLACLGLGLVHAVSQGAIAWALGRVPAATASVVILIQPVCAAILGWVIFKEALVPMQAMGGLAALAGVAVAQFAAARKARPEPV